MSASRSSGHPIRVSENSNRTDDLGDGPSRSNLVAIVLVLISIMLLLGYFGNGPLGASPTGSTAVVQQGAITGFNFLFGNFSGMTLLENYTAPGGNRTSFIISYSLLGVTRLDNTRAYEVNISGITESDGEEDRESALAWVSTSSGQVIQTYDSDQGYLQGSRAEAENTTLAEFTTEPLLSMMNSSGEQQVHGLRQVVTLGQVTMYVTTYDSLDNTSNFDDLVTQVGVIPASGLQLVVYCSYISWSGYKFAFRLISVEDANPAPA